MITASSGCFALRCFPLLFGLAGACTGCASLTPGSFDPNASAVAAAPGAPGNGPKCRVEIRGKHKKRERLAIPLEGPTTVNEVVAKSGADRFSGMKISILRKNPQGQPIKLKVNYDRGEHRVDPASDYAVFPNDTIIIEDDPRNIFNAAVDSLTAGNVLFR